MSGWLKRHQSAGRSCDEPFTADDVCVCVWPGAGDDGVAGWTARETVQRMNKGRDCSSVLQMMSDVDIELSSLERASLL